MAQDDVTTLTRRGLDAFKRGKAREAFEALSGAADAGAEGRDVHLPLAFVARMLGHHERALASADRVAGREPRNFEALIIKADALAAMGERRKAATSYLAAVRAAPAKLPEALAKEVARASAACTETTRAYEDFLRARVTEAMPAPPAPSRAGQALDIMFGRKQIHVQQPLKFYFPELPQIQVYDATTFDWVRDMEAATDAVRREARAAWSGEAGVEPYVPADSARPHVANKAIMGNRDWSAFHLYREGEAQPDNIARCPETMTALARAPQPDIPNNSPTALYSVLRPGFHIPPHHGMMNVRLICHLPLVVPADCVLRVGNQEQRWEEGRMLIFDDSIEHEARNDSGEVRIVLLFDIWRPELTDEERAFVATVYDGIAAFDAT